MSLFGKQVCNKMFFWELIKKAKGISNIGMEITEKELVFILKIYGILEEPCCGMFRNKEYQGNRGIKIINILYFFCINVIYIYFYRY